MSRRQFISSNPTSRNSAASRSPAIAKNSISLEDRRATDVASREVWERGNLAMRTTDLGVIARPNVAETVEEIARFTSGFDRDVSLLRPNSKRLLGNGPRAARRGARSDHDRGRHMGRGHRGHRRWSGVHVMPVAARGNRNGTGFGKRNAPTQVRWFGMGSWMTWGSSASGKSRCRG